MKTGYIILLLLSFFLAACGASVPRFTNERYSDEGEKRPPKISNTTANDLSEYEDAKPLDVFTGVASYYADQYNGNRTSSGEVYDMNSLTAAYQELPFNTIVRVTNLGNNKFVLLRINDRGPLKKGRIIDVSLAAAKKLGMIGTGTANVRVEVLKYGDKPL